MRVREFRALTLREYVLLTKTWYEDFKLIDSMHARILQLLMSITESVSSALGSQVTLREIDELRIIKDSNDRRMRPDQSSNQSRNVKITVSPEEYAKNLEEARAINNRIAQFAVEMRAKGQQPTNSGEEVK